MVRMVRMVRSLADRTFQLWLDVSTTVVILDTMEADGTYVWTGLKLTFREEQSVANGDPYDAAAVDVRSPSNKDPNTS